MPAIGVPQNSFSMPSIGEIVRAAPKVMVGFLAVFSGVANAHSEARQSGPHGGGLVTKAYALWRDGRARQMQACLSEPWVQGVDADRAGIECELRGIADWLRTSPDLYANTVVSRGMERHNLHSSRGAAEGQTTVDLRKVSREVNNIFRTNPKYGRVMEKTAASLCFYSKIPKSDLAKPTQRYTADYLIGLLDDEGKRDFMNGAGPLSYELHTMAMKAGDFVAGLNPELMPSTEDRQAFRGMVEKNFVGPAAGMNDQQFHVLMKLLAKHVNQRNSALVA